MTISRMSDELGHPREDFLSFLHKGEIYSKITLDLYERPEMKNIAGNKFDISTISARLLRA